MAAITRYEPARMVPLSNAINQLLGESFAFPRVLGRELGATPGSSLYETPDGFELHVALPGAKADDVAITVQNEVVTLKAKSTHASPEGARVLWSDLGALDVSHRFTLPAPVNAEAARAEFTDGILRLTLPKVEHAKARMIKVNGGATVSEQ